LLLGPKRQQEITEFAREIQSGRTGSIAYQTLYWREVARMVLHLDPEHAPGRTRRAFDSHLSRAKWMTEHGYRHLLRSGASA
jgi:hypothetical protein